MTRNHLRLGSLVVLALGLALSACGDDDDCCLIVDQTPASRLVFGNEGNRLRAYDPALGTSQVVLPSATDDPAAGRDVNGAICFAPDGSRRFVAGEDTGQPARPPGWGVFQLHGRNLGGLSATQIGKLVPTYQDSRDNREPFGCAFLPDGRLLTTDVGEQASGPATGQLILWFDPLGPAPRYCKLDVAIGTAGGIWVDDDGSIYVASARVDPGIHRYAGTLPTSDTPAGGCDSSDATGAPLTTELTKERFINSSGALATPSGVVQSPAGTFYVASVINGSILEYDDSGRLLRAILRPPSGEQAPYSTGTPFGLAIDSDGTLYYADLAIVVQLDDIGPAPGRGTFRRIRFEDGDPLAPEKLDDGLNFPDGVAVLE